MTDDGFRLSEAKCGLANSAGRGLVETMHTRIPLHNSDRPRCPVDSEHSAHHHCGYCTKGKRVERFLCYRCGHTIPNRNETVWSERGSASSSGLMLWWPHSVGPNARKFWKQLRSLGNLERTLHLLGTSFGTSLLGDYACLKPWRSLQPAADYSMQTVPPPKATVTSGVSHKSWCYKAQAAPWSASAWKKRA